MKRSLKILKWTLGILTGLILVVIAIVYGYMLQDKFGKAPDGIRLKQIQAAANYRQDQFQNTRATPMLTEGYSMLGILYDQLFKEHPRREPKQVIPSQKVNLLSLPRNADVLVWFGHSSYFMQLNGKRILVDPVFSGNASPVPGTVAAYPGTDRYTVADLPPIDYLFISHDHYDHLDYETILALKAKVKQVICGIGVGAHFEKWGYSANQLLEKNWNEEIQLANDFTVYTLPARHFSGRGFARNNTLWLSFLIKTANFKVYIGGDGGYDTHFAEIGKQHGPIDLAVLENGQYNPAWSAIHLMPDQLFRAAEDLQATRLFPVHSGKFTLALHPWDEPLIKAAENGKASGIGLVTPLIGELVNLPNTKQVFKEWWRGIP